MKKDAFFDFFKLMKPDMQDIMKKTPRYFISVLIAGIFLFTCAGSAWSEQNERADEFFTTFLKEKHSIWFRGITATEDGYVAVGGITRMGGSTEPNGFAAKIDKFGNIKWEKEFSSQPKGSFFNKVAATGENKTILVGMKDYVRKPEWQAGSYSASSGWVVKLTAEGATEWDKTLQVTEKAHFKGEDIVVKPVIVASDVSPMKSGDMIVLGHMRHGIFDTPIVWRMDKEGKVLWEKTFKRGDSIWPDIIRVYSNDEYVACGSATNFENDGFHVWIMKFNAQGKILWEKKLRGLECRAIAVLKNEIFVGGATGGVENADTGKKSAMHHWLSKLNRKGRIVFRNHIKARDLCGITNLWQNDASNMVVVGRTCETERERIWVGIFSTSGEMISHRRYFAEEKMELDFAIPHGHDGFIAALSGGKRGEDSFAAGLLRITYDSDKYK